MFDDFPIKINVCPNTVIKKAEKKSRTLDKIIRSAKKFGVTSLLIGALTINPLLGATKKKEDPSLASKKQTKKFSFFWDAALTYRSSILASIKGVPFKVRDIPKHPAEPSWLYVDVAPIEKDSVKLYDRIEMGTKFGGRIYLIKDKILLRAGLGIDLSIATVLSENNKRKDMEERNYTNAPGTNKRGYGAALTFYQVIPTFGPPYLTNAYLRPSLFSEIEAKIGKKTTLALGCTLHWQNFQIRNGWDRYDDLQTRERYDLAKLTVGGPYVSIKFYSKELAYYIGEKLYGGGKSYISIDVGITKILKKHLTEMGKSMELDFNDPAFFIAIRQSLYWK